MSDQSTKFTLEIKGIELPGKVQEDISKALNQTLMQKIGELDLAAGTKAGGTPLYLTKYLPNGGKLEKLFSQALQNQLEKELHVSPGETFGLTNSF